MRNETSLTSRWVRFGAAVTLLLSAAAHAADAHPKYRLLHGFDFVKGDLPIGGKLVQGADGFIYGTTLSGGPDEWCGVVYKISASGKFHVLHRFQDNGRDGCGSRGGLVPAADGSFYGTTGAGGKDNAGTLFRLGADGQVTVVHRFPALGGAGRQPTGGLCWRRMASSTGRPIWRPVRQRHRLLLLPCRRREGHLLVRFAAQRR